MNEETQPKRKITLTVAVIHTKTRSRKYSHYVTRGYYLNIPQEIIRQMGLNEKELVEITIKKIV